MKKLNKGKTDDNENDEDKPDDVKKNGTENKPQAEEEEKVKKARKVAPKFVPDMLNDPQKGLESLYKRVGRLDENTVKGNKESLAILMRIYQQWVFQLFPADFGDMCNKLNSLPSVKKIVKSFVFDKKGFNSISDRILDSFAFDEDDEKEKNDEENLQPSQEQEKTHFLDDNNNDDDIDISITDNFDNNSYQPESQTTEILDFIGQDAE